MIRSLRLLTVLLLAAGVAGCIRGTLPARELYRLAPPDSVLRALEGASPPGDAMPVARVARATLDGTLAIMPFATPGIYGDRGIVFRLDDAEYGVYPSREWAMPLGDMLGLIAARLAPSHGLTREAPLFDPPSPRAQTYLWRATVREFEEVNRGRQLSVAVRIDASIVRARDDSVVWTASLGRERAVTEGQDMPAVVRALSALATGVVQELLGRAARELAVPAADSARRTP